METFSALLALCAGNSPVTGEFPSQRPVTLGFDVFFDRLGLNKRLSKHSWFGDVRHHRAHYNVIVMKTSQLACEGEILGVFPAIFVWWTAANSVLKIVQWNLSVTTTSIIKCITCDLFSNVF